ncbi:TetR/AcrR family transcriptional regulator [Variovorax sp. ZS18.2.2]|uniref:TetR/AcrR family transcriptional regulator n=1 Tax=Variovorax sp. ZS18.2.2 TaxID=2971255 RepID=UPI002150BC68|nr:TetR/AcrR family transcriptional regulator [Variovorax sp. ZS18.2.2]MCR6478195.1 TetR/AcrR family transcriptional regulator [Variovorax sp. ZS18.2.2]
MSTSEVSSAEPARKRNAAATREAILLSARKAFARAGYDGAGVREIAAGAGVTAMLVNRYFGSKEQLFAEVVAEGMKQPIILSEKNIGSTTMARDFAKALVAITDPHAPALEGFQVMLRSASSQRAAEIGREEIEKGHQRTMATLLRGRLAPQRAALLLSLVAGVQVMRQMVGLSALADADPAALVKLLEPLIQQLLDDGKTPKPPKD